MLHNNFENFRLQRQNEGKKKRHKVWARYPPLTRVWPECCPSAARVPSGEDYRLLSRTVACNRVYISFRSSCFERTTQYTLIASRQTLDKRLSTLKYCFLEMQFGECIYKALVRCCVHSSFRRAGKKLV